MALADVPPRAQPADRTVGRAWARAAIVLAIVAIALFAAGAVLGFAAVGRTGGGPVQGWDNTVWRWATAHHGPFVGAAKIVATVGDAVALGVICVVLTGALAGWLRSPRALVLVVAYFGAEFEVFAIRQVIHRPRPAFADFASHHAVHGVHETSFSYPSGHATAVTAVLFAGLATVAFTRGRNWPWLLAVVVSIAAADTRLILGVHWFSDVAVGLLIGIAWGMTVALVAQRVEWSDYLLG
ncbi:MAG: phosphatase PAP2 family protein [Jatrophihabitantaceae bacterium]